MRALILLALAATSQATTITAGQEITALFSTSLTRSVAASIDPSWDGVFDPIRHTVRLWDAAGAGSIRLESIDGSAVSAYSALMQQTGSASGSSVPVLVTDVLLPSPELSALIHASSEVRVRIVTTGSLSASFTAGAFSYISPSLTTGTHTFGGGRPLYGWQIVPPEPLMYSTPEAHTPEPASWMALSTGLLWFALRRCSNRNRAAPSSRQ